MLRNNRRSYLTALSSAAALGLAGCFGDSGDDDDDTSPDEDDDDENEGEGDDDGVFVVDAQSIVGRSDIVLDEPPLLPKWAMGVGNGQFGAAVWGEDGYTAQLNPNHTAGVEWKTAGQLSIPELSTLTDADDYGGRVDLYDAVFRQSGDGVTAETYVHATEDHNLFVLDVTGADPDEEYTVEWSFDVASESDEERDPNLSDEDGAAVVTESWPDEGERQLMGEHDRDERRTWSLVSALAVDGRDRSIEITDPDDGPASLEYHARPDDDGRLRVFVSTPAYPGEDVDEAVQDAVATVNDAVEQSSDALESSHAEWWHDFWDGANLWRLESDDGEAEFHENVRTLYLYYLASSNRGLIPGHHAGEGHLFRYQGDHIDWLGHENGWWHFNVRLQALASFPAGVYELNDPIFRLYRETLDYRKDVTREEMETVRGVSENVGAAIPEVMTQLGRGSWQLTGEPYYTRRINSTGGEVTHLIWLYYEYTQDEEFLEENYPVMAEATRFMLAYAREDNDGVLYTEPSNAHETLWDTRNPSTDVAVMKSTFPVVEELADRFGDDELAADLEAAIPKIPEFPEDNDDTIAWSEEGSTNWENTVNVDTEPIYPWGLFDDSGSPETTFARRTFENREFIMGGRNVPDPHTAKPWTLDAAQAARLGMTEEFRTLLWDGIQIFNAPKPYDDYPAGLPSGLVTQTLGNPYVEWLGAHAASVQEAAVQSYDGLVRIAPAWPAEWDGDIAADVVGGHRVVTKLRDGEPLFVGVQAGADDEINLRNPWSDQSVRVVAESDRPEVGGEPEDTVVDAADDLVLSFAVEAGETYVVEPADDPASASDFDPVAGEQRESPRTLEEAEIGLPSAVTLVPSAVRVPETDETTATLEVDVENLGTAISEPTPIRLVEVTEDGRRTIADLTVPEIRPENSVELSHEWDISDLELGTTRILRAIVDPDNEHGLLERSPRAEIPFYEPLPEEYEFYASTDATAGIKDDHLVINANGEEVWAEIDEYGAIYRPGEQLGPDGTATVKVVAQENTSDWANAGVMVREDVTAAGESTSYAHIAATPRWGFMFEWDSDDNGFVDDRETEGEPTYPCWVRLERDGDTVTGSFSTDGESWTEVESTVLDDADEELDVAIFVTSGTREETSEVEFDEFEVTN